MSGAPDQIPAPKPPLDSINHEKPVTIENEYDLWPSAKTTTWLTDLVTPTTKKKKGAVLPRSTSNPMSRHCESRADRK